MYLLSYVDRRSNLLHRDSTQLMGRNRLKNYRQHTKWRPNCQVGVNSDHRIHLLTTQRLQFLLPRILARTHSHCHHTWTQRSSHINRRNCLQGTQRWHASLCRHYEKLTVPKLPPRSNCWGTPSQKLCLTSNTISNWICKMLLCLPRKAIRRNSSQIYWPYPNQHCWRKSMCFSYGVLEQFCKRIKKYRI